jgi:hypothetical protein
MLEFTRDPYTVSLMRLNATHVLPVMFIKIHAQMMAG